MKRLIFSTFILFGFISCSQSNLTKKNHLPVKYSILYQSQYGGSGEEKSEIFSDFESFSKMWNATINSNNSNKDIPKIDFSNMNVVVHHFQSRNNGGTTYEIQQIKSVDGNTKIFYKVYPSEGMNTMAITNPLMILSVENKNPNVEFILEK